MRNFLISLLSVLALLPLSLIADPVDTKGSMVTVVEVTSIKPAVFDDHSDGPNALAIPMSALVSSDQYFRIDLVVESEPVLGGLYRERPKLGIWLDGKFFEFAFESWFLMGSDPVIGSVGKELRGLSVYLRVSEGDHWFKPYVYLSSSNSRVWDAHLAGLENYHLVPFSRWAGSETLTECSRRIKFFH